MPKKYLFHIETFHLPHPYDEEWFQEFPMELTDEQFERLCNAHKNWIENDGFFKRDCLEDDEYLIHRDLPDIWEKFRAEVADRAPKIWDEGIIPYLSQIDLYIPDEAYDVNCPHE